MLLLGRSRVVSDPRRIYGAMGTTEECASTLKSKRADMVLACRSGSVCCLAAALLSEPPVGPDARENERD